MSELSYLKVFLDWGEATRKLKDAEKGRLIDALVAYASGEENADSRLTGNEAYVFPVFQLQIDRDKAEISKKRQTNSENGKHGGAPKGNQNARKNNRNQPESTENNRNKPDKEEDYRLLTTDDDEYPPNPPAGGTDAPPAEKPKRKRNPPTPPELTPDEEAALLAFSPGLCAEVRDWFRYKAERRQMYGDTFRRKFIATVTENARKYGADAVAAVISESASNGYQGVTWDRLSKPQYGGGTAAPPRESWAELAAEIERERGENHGFM